MPRAARAFRDAAIDFNSTVCELQGTELFIDGTKYMLRFLALRALTAGATFRIIHVVRDPRGFYMSYKKHSQEPDSEALMYSHWLRYHKAVLAHFLSMEGVEVLFLRYEDLCTEPSRQMDRVFRFLKLSAQDVVGRLKDPHHIIGNRMLASFDGSIEQDTLWRQHLSCKKQMEVLRRTEPLSSLFGYRLES